MLFSGKTSGHFVEINEYSTLVARTSAFEAPLVIEKIEEVPGQGLPKVGELLDKVAGPRRAGAYRHVVCGVSPEQRFIRRAALDPKRAKDAAYLEEVLTTQFRAEPDKMTLTMLAAGEGNPLDLGGSVAKDVLFCGGYSAEFTSIQQTLLAAGIFPERLELTSVAMLGSMLGVLALNDVKTPTLLLEIGRETTNCYIVSASGVDLARPIPHGINSMIPVAQKELGLRDEEAAAKLLFSNTFDFTGMAPNLVKRLLKELQSSIGFFEVQTGQSIGQLHCVLQPAGLPWLSAALAGALGVTQLQVDSKAWFEKQGIKFASGVCPDGVPVTWFGLLSLMANNQPSIAPNETK